MAKGLPYLRLIVNRKLMCKFTDPSMKKIFWERRQQKAIAKAGIADCGIATVHTYEGIVRGLFGKDANVTVKHTKNLNRGDECCEVVVSM